MENNSQVLATITNYHEVIWIISEVGTGHIIYKQGTHSPSSIHYVGNDKLHVAKLRRNTKGQYFLVQGTKYYLNTALRNI